MRWLPVCLLCWACDPVPPATMHDVAFPDGFALDARSDVTVTIAVARPDEADDAAVIVRVPADGSGGEPLLEGALADVVDVPLTFRLPPDVRALEVVVVSPHGEQVLPVMIDAAGRADVEVP